MALTQHFTGAVLALGFTCTCEHVSQGERGWNEVETAAVLGGGARGEGGLRAGECRRGSPPGNVVLGKQNLQSNWGTRAEVALQSCSSKGKKSCNSFHAGRKGIVWFIQGVAFEGGCGEKTLLAMEKSEIIGDQHWSCQVEQWETLMSASTAPAAPLLVCSVAALTSAESCKEGVLQWQK